MVYFLNKRLKPVHFDRPSLNIPIYKPLQFVRFIIFSALFVVLGEALRLPFLNAKGMMNFYFECTLVLSFFLSERIVYRVYRSKISPSFVNQTS